MILALRLIRYVGRRCDNAAVLTTRERLVEVAFRLFTEQGYEQTTVDQVAQAAGVSRATFFRLFSSKEAVIFPDHEPVLSAVDARLAMAEASEAGTALHEAARLVMRRYLDEGETARARYRLTQSVPALRDTELASLVLYQRIFRRHLRRWLADVDQIGQTAYSRALPDLLANAVVTLHNQVLLQWLRGNPIDPETGLREAINEVLDRLWSSTATHPDQVVVLRTAQDLDRLLPQLQRILRS